MRELACIVILLLAGCSSTVTFKAGEMTTNARLVAEYTVAADGARSWKIDTMQQTFFDRLKTGVSNMMNYLTRALDQAAPRVE